MVTPREVARLVADEQDIERRRFQFASELDRAQEERQLRKRIKADMAAYGNPTAGILPSVLALSPVERRTYRVSALVINMMAPGRPESSLEREVSQGIAGDLKQSPEHGGVYVPLRITATTGLDTRQNPSGGYLTSPRVGDILNSLQNQTKVLQLGGRLLTNLRYSKTFPVESTPMGATWVGENSGSDVAQTDPVFGYRSMTPHSLQACTTVSKQLLTQSNNDLESWLRDRVGKAHGLAIDLAAIAGTAVQNQPLGLLGTQGIGNVPSGGTVTAVHIRSLEASVGTANASADTCAFLATSAMREKLRTIAEFTGGSLPLWRDGRMLGYVAEVSNQVPSNALIFGDFNTILIGEFLGVLELVVDQFTAKKAGNVEIASFGMYDVLCSQPPALAAITDIS